MVTPAIIQEIYLCLLTSEKELKGTMTYTYKGGHLKIIFRKVGSHEMAPMLNAWHIGHDQDLGKMLHTCNILLIAFVRAGFKSPGCNLPLS